MFLWTTVTQTSQRLLLPLGTFLQVAPTPHLIGVPLPGHLEELGKPPNFPALFNIPCQSSRSTTRWKFPRLYYSLSSVKYILLWCCLSMVRWPRASLQRLRKCPRSKIGNTLQLLDYTSTSGLEDDIFYSFSRTLEYFETCKPHELTTVRAMKENEWACIYTTKIKYTDHFYTLLKLEIWETG